MVDRAPHKSPTASQGSALIITLGLLAVMIILAVSFSISSRTERLASRYYVDVVKARQLTHTALNRVIGDHIPNSMSGSTYPGWPGDILTSGKGANPAESVFFLHNLSMGINTGAALYVSGSMLDAALSADGVRWIEMKNDDDDFICEYAFLVANSSGLLDAHVVGGREDASKYPEPRLSRGFNPEEIRFHWDVLPEVITGAPVGNLVSNRALFGRFENVPELHWLLSETSSRLSYRGPPLLKQFPAGAADNLHVFSRFPRGYARASAGGAPEAVTNVAYIGGDPANWDIATISNAISDLVSAGTIPNADAFIGVLYDYASSDYELYPVGGDPDRKFNRISSKPVPMINEIVVSNSISFNYDLAATNTVLTNNVYITVETWYPFATPGGVFNVRYGSSAAAVPNIQMAGFSGPFVPLTGPGLGSTLISTPPNSFTNTTFAFQRVSTFPGFIPTPLNWTFQQEVELTDFIFVHQGSDASGTIVDRVLPSWPSKFIIQNPPIDLIDNYFSYLGAVGKYANDPRINWDPSISGQWRTGQEIPSLGAINATVPSSSDELIMYARMGPLRSVGELGFLLYNASTNWTTVKLAGPDPDNAVRLLDRFTVHTNLVRRGLVNPNTRQRDPLVAALWGVYTEEHPEKSSPSGLTLNEARSLADNLMVYTSTQGAITNLSEIGQAWNASTLNTVLGAQAATNKFFRESVIRNTLGLLSPRHNLFTIFVAARTFADNYDPQIMQNVKEDYVTSEQRAVAVVWRDPYLTSKDYSGGGKSPPTYQSWIQYFHWFSGIFEE